MSETGADDEDVWVDVEELEEMELRIIAEKVMEMLTRDLALERERMGLSERWGGWRQS